MTTKLLFGLALAAFGALTAPAKAETASAAPLGPPTGAVILTVSGDIGVHNADGRAEFDRGLLEALPQTEVVTWTPWTGREPVRFSGVLMSDLMERLCASGGPIVASALNDYRVEIPMSDLDRHDVLLALRRDGKVMPVRDKGPLWIIYRLDPAEPVLAEIEGRMVWQLDELIVR